MSGTGRWCAGTGQSDSFEPPRQPGDTLVEVDGRAAEQYTLAELRELSRSEPGRVLGLLVRRNGELHQISIRLERRI
jgi:C-terminal processing protease CtpA/Prc